jgi:transcription initiation factor TFIIB
MHYKRKSLDEVLDEILECYECGSSEIEHDTKHGERVCAECGLVLEDKLIDEGPEWREYTGNSPDASRVGSPSTPAFFYASRTVMNFREASKENKEMIRRIGKWNARVNDSKQRHLIDALTALDALSGQLELTKPTHNYAARLYRKAVEKNLIRGRSKDGIVGACIYIAGRENNQIQDLNVLGEKLKKSRKEIGSYVRVLNSELKLKTKILLPEEYIPKFISKLAKNKDSYLYESEEAELAIGKVIGTLSGHFNETMINIGNPLSAAAAYIYITSVLLDAKITQKEIAEVSGLTEVTIRNRYREFVNYLPEDVKTDYFPRQ